MGHYAQECRKLPARESPGCTTTNHVAVSKVSDNPLWPEDLTKAQLEDLLAERCKKKGLLEEDSGKRCVVTAETHLSSELVWPTVLLDIVVERVPIKTVVGTGSQSTIISR